DTARRSASAGRVTAGCSFTSSSRAKRLRNGRSAGTSSATSARTDWASASSPRLNRYSTSAARNRCLSGSCCRAWRSACSAWAPCPWAMASCTCSRNASTCSSSLWAPWPSTGASQSRNAFSVCAPSSSPASLPCTTSFSVGRLRTPNWPVMACSTSALTLASNTWPFSSRTSFSSTGAICLHGWHQSAQKSTMTGICMDLASTDSKFCSVTSTIKDSATAGSLLTGFSGSGSVPGSNDQTQGRGGQPRGIARPTGLLGQANYHINATVFLATFRALVVGDRACFAITNGAHDCRVDLHLRHQVHHHGLGALFGQFQVAVVTAVGIGVALDGDQVTLRQFDGLLHLGHQRQV